MRTYIVLVSNGGSTKWKIFWTFKGAITCAMQLIEKSQYVEVLNRHTGKTIFKKENKKEEWRLK